MKRTLRGRESGRAPQPADAGAQSVRVAESAGADAVGGDRTPVVGAQVGSLHPADAQRVAHQGVVQPDRAENLVGVAFARCEEAVGVADVRIFRRTPQLRGRKPSVPVRNIPAGSISGRRRRCRRGNRCRCVRRGRASRPVRRRASSRPPLRPARRGYAICRACGRSRRGRCRRRGGSGASLRGGRRPSGTLRRRRSRRARRDGLCRNATGRADRLRADLRRRRRARWRRKAAA